MHLSRIYILPALFLTTLLAPAGGTLEAGPVDAQGRPLIKKLGTIDLDKVETNPVVFRGVLYRFEWDRKNKYFHFVEHDTGCTTPPFAHGWRFGCAFVDGDSVYVTGTKESSEVRMFVSKDLGHWDAFPILQLPRWKIFNTSICKAGDKYVLMLEVGALREEAGVPFTARFATSTDLRRWTLAPRECNYAMDRYTAPHCLRWLDGWFYDFYLEDLHGKFEQYVVRSKDLIHWDSSPLNPVLRASPEDRKAANPRFTSAQRKRLETAVNINNSDIDFCEHQGRLIINYSWGNQQGVEHLAEAVYEGSLAEFLRGWFPEKPSVGSNK